MLRFRKPRYNIHKRFMITRRLFLLLLSVSFFESSCSVFDLFDDHTVDGKFFNEDNVAYHFQENCFFPKTIQWPSTTIILIMQNYLVW